jgi:D-alanyl-lipoteichoic acid acyltransferase DltB (MBOAT superfamily)
MLFNSISFLLFFPTVCLLYFAIPAERVRLRNGLLLVASYWFYMNWEPAYALLLLLSTVATWAAALGMDRQTGDGRPGRSRRRWLVGSLVVNLAILFLFKYYNFLTGTLTGALLATGLSVSMPRFHLLLPVGISFYTFQALGYTIDVYRGNVRAERDLLTYALFVSFFPQLVAGPIERSGRLLPQFRERHRLAYGHVTAGLRMMAWGYFMKLVVADRCGLYVDAVFDNVAMHNGGSCLMASLLFPFQIYGDFAGYSLIAIGTARVLGFRLMENFRSPYLSCSVGEFWHRWHISLSTWFRDYVYIPLGGNRRGRPRQYVNLLVTFTVSGLWHGANWTFLCWGALHGVLLCMERALGIGRTRYRGLSRLMHWGLTFLLVSMGWVLFRAATLHDALAVYTSILTSLAVPDLSFAMFTEICTASVAIAVLMGREAMEEYAGHRLPSFLPHPMALRTVRLSAVVACGAAILLFGVLGGDQFIYFQF